MCIGECKNKSGRASQDYCWVDTNGIMSNSPILLLIIFLLLRGVRLACLTSRCRKHINLFSNIVWESLCEFKMHVKSDRMYPFKV